MNIWDSVHRSLEKASQEAGRIARTQRLRSTIEKLSLDIDTQQGALITQAMALFTSQQLTQSELISICQQLTDLHQQLLQAQNELKQLQGQGIMQSALAAGQPPAQGEATPASAVAPTLPAQPTPVLSPTPAYQPYFDSTLPIPTPPPPPGVEPLEVGSLDTGPIRTGDAAAPRICTNCHVETLPGNAYCHNCGLPLQNSAAAYQPTVRSDSAESAGITGMETIPLSTPADTPHTPAKSITPITSISASNTETVQNELPASRAEHPAPTEEDGGH